GLDLVAGDVYPYDDDAHGSHVAGLAAGRGFGVARKASVIPVKVMTSLGGDTGSIAAGIVYAVDRGARIINLSLGAQAALPHPAMVKAAAYAEAHDAVLVVAAGNGDPSTGLGFSIDTKSVFPASLQNDNLITVAASSGGKLAPYSNFGARDVDVVAPGGKTPDDVMISAAYDNPEGALFIGMNGTSMATPVVSGVLALLLDVNPNLTGKELKNAVLAAGPRSPELSSVTVSGRLLDAYEALTLSRQSAASF
ncbi:MAG TPA: S8 family serine peptidase, partial [Bdellovibrionales bacterium]|nr:S8 family serine peptidase [Bdellovibrionales bacterium]